MKKRKSSRNPAGEEAAGSGQLHMALGFEALSRGRTVTAGVTVRNTVPESLIVNPPAQDLL